MSSIAFMFQFLGTTWPVRSCGAAALAAGLALGMLYGPLPELRAQASERFVSSENFERQMESAVGVTWENKPLRGALETLSQSQGVGIFLDRRIDPGQEIDFSAEPMPLERLLLRLTTELELGYCRVGEVIYIGPPETAEVLETVAALRRQEEEAFSNDRRRELTRDRQSGWPALSQPRELLAAAAHEVGIAWDEESRLPHDLWPAVELPPMRFADRATLILAGFDLTYALDDEGIALAVQPLPSEAVIELDYARGNHGDSVVVQLSEQFPNSQIEAVGERIVVTGPMKDQRLIRRLLAGEQVRRAAVAEAQRQYTLRVAEQPVGGLMRALAQQLGKEVEFDPSLEAEKLNERVSFEVENVDLEGLLEAALTPAGLKAEVQGETIRVLPAGN